LKAIFENTCVCVCVYTHTLRVRKTIIYPFDTFTIHQSYVPVSCWEQAEKFHLIPLPWGWQITLPAAQQLLTPKAWELRRKEGTWELGAGGFLWEWAPPNSSYRKAKLFYQMFPNDFKVIHRSGIDSEPLIYDDHETDKVPYIDQQFH
jgi:hypothetical protein